MLRDSTPRFVGPSVGPSVGPLVRPSVGPSHFTFSAFFSFLALPLLPKCSGDLKYGPCPPARDWDSRVSGLVNNMTKLFFRARPEPASLWLYFVVGLSIFARSEPGRLSLIWCDMLDSSGFDHFRRISEERKKYW